MAVATVQVVITQTDKSIIKVKCKEAYVVFVKHSKDQGGELGRISLREELLIDFYETLEKIFNSEIHILMRSHIVGAVIQGTCHCVESCDRMMNG